MFYRYISYPVEIQQIVAERKIQSTNPSEGFATWYTPTRYNNPAEAKSELALRTLPTHRVGPIPLDELPPLDIGPRRADPADGEPGGGTEVRTRHPVWLFGLWAFPSGGSEGRWDL